MFVLYANGSNGVCSNDLAPILLMYDLLQVKKKVGPSCWKKSGFKLGKDSPDQRVRRVLKTGLHLDGIGHPDPSSISPLGAPQDRAIVLSAFKGSVRELCKSESGGVLRG